MLEQQSVPRQPAFLVVYESMFGDAKQIAEAVARGLTEASGEFALPVEAGQAPDVIPSGVTLLVAGSPTHGFSMPRPQSRADAAEQADGPIISSGRGLREWLEVVRPERAGTPAVTFDTRMDHPKLLTKMDHASRQSAKALKKRGFALASDSQHFVVQDVKGPLASGEVERAHEWGRSLACLVSA